MKILDTTTLKTGDTSALLAVDFTLPEKPDVYTAFGIMDLAGSLQEGLYVSHKDAPESIDNIPMPTKVIAAIQEVAIQQAKNL